MELPCFCGITVYMHGRKLSNNRNIDGSTMSKNTYALIHGSWHGGWAWQDVSRSLVEKGHRVHAPTLPGHGPRATSHSVTHQECVGAVVDYIREHELTDVILVGHSFGGTIVQKVAEQLTVRISRNIFLDALILADNDSVFDNLPADYVALFNQLAAASSDNTMLIPWEIWRDNFMLDASEIVARSFWEQLSAEPHQLNSEKLDLKGFTRSIFQVASFTAGRIERYRQAIFIHECPRALDHSSWLRWTAAMRLCSLGRRNWRRRSSRQATNPGERDL